METQSLATLINGSRVTLYNATLNNATLLMFTYLILLISHVYTVFYNIYSTLPMPLGHRSSVYLYVHILIHPLDSCVLGCCWGIVELLDYLLDNTVLSELEAQAFGYTRNNIC